MSTRATAVATEDSQCPGGSVATAGAWTARLPLSHGLRPGPHSVSPTGLQGPRAQPPKLIIAPWRNAYAAPYPVGPMARRQRGRQAVPLQSASLSADRGEWRVRCREVVEPTLRSGCAFAANGKPQLGEEILKQYQATPKAQAAEREGVQKETSISAPNHLVLDRSVPVDYYQYTL
jgi:hypothetical protein